MKAVVLIVFVALGVLPLDTLWAYEAGPVTDGGTVSGIVSFKGTVPPPKTLDLTKDKAICGKSKTDQSLIVSDGHLANAVVSITDIAKPPGTYTVEAWHETLGKTSQKVTVKAREDSKVNFELAGK